MVLGLDRKVEEGGGYFREHLAAGITALNTQLPKELRVEIRGLTEPPCHAWMWAKKGKTLFL